MGISAFGEEGDETPIEIVPDVVLDDDAPKPDAEVGSGGKAKAKAGADG